MACLVMSGSSRAILIFEKLDDEKFFHSPKLTLEEVHKFALQNAADIIAIGFDVKKTFMFIDTDFVDGGHGAAFNYNVRLMGKRTTINQIKGTFGFGDRYGLKLPTCPRINSCQQQYC